MKELKVIEQNNELFVDSREVAEMVGKRHSDLVRSIETYQGFLSQNAKLRSDDFFVESNYQAGTGKFYKHYLLTKKGCDMVANKMTGEKGIIFTAMYVDAFHKMQNLLLVQDSYMIADPVERAKKWIEEQEVRKQLEIKTAIQEQQIGELKPKADYVDEILKSYGTVITTQIAADYGISAQKLNKILHKAKLQRKVNNQWILYTEHMNKSYTESDTIDIVRSDGRKDTVIQTRWTQKGRLKIHEIMTSLGYEAKTSNKERGVIA